MKIVLRQSCCHEAQNFEYWFSAETGGKIHNSNLILYIYIYIYIYMKTRNQFIFFLIIFYYIVLKRKINIISEKLFKIFKLY